MKNAKLRINDCINDCIYLTYDFRMTIIIREYEICTENGIKHWIVCLEPGRRIDRHAYREDTVAATYRYRYRGPVWVDEIDHVWITVAPKGSPQHLRALMDHCFIQ